MESAQFAIKFIFYRVALRVNHTVAFYELETHVLRRQDLQGI